MDKADMTTREDFERLAQELRNIAYSNSDLTDSERVSCLESEAALRTLKTQPTERAAQQGPQLFQGAMHGAVLNDDGTVTPMRPAAAPQEATPRKWTVFCGVCKKQWTVPYYHPGKSICEACERELAPYQAGWNGSGNG